MPISYLQTLPKQRIKYLSQRTGLDQRLLSQTFLVWPTGLLSSIQALSPSPSVQWPETVNVIIEIVIDYQ